MAGNIENSVTHNDSIVRLEKRKKKTAKVESLNNIVGN